MAECGRELALSALQSSVRTGEGAGGLLLGGAAFVQGGETEGLAWAGDGG